MKRRLPRSMERPVEKSKAQLRRKRRWRCHVRDCELRTRHLHCRECGAIGHTAAYCDNLG